MDMGAILSEAVAARGKSVCRCKAQIGSRNWTIGLDWVPAFGTAEIQGQAHLLTQIDLL